MTRLSSIAAAGNARFTTVDRRIETGKLSPRPLSNRNNSNNNNNNNSNSNN